MYSIIRIMKLHGRDITASDNHCLRKSEVKNADPSLKLNNIYLPNRKNGSVPLSAAIEKTIERENIVVPRKDSVKCIEILMAMPPEMWELEKSLPTNSANPSKSTRGPLTNLWMKASLDFVKKEAYSCSGRTMLDFHVHFDESTPHIHFHLMPGETLADGTIKLNAKKHFGGRLKLQQLQDRYHAHMQESMPTMGFKRGEKKEITGKSHVQIKDYYKSISIAQKMGITPDEVEALIREKVAQKKKEDQPTAKLQSELDFQQRQVKEESKDQDKKRSKGIKR